MAEHKENLAVSAAQDGTAIQNQAVISEQEPLTTPSIQLDAPRVWTRQRLSSFLSKPLLALKTLSGWTGWGDSSSSFLHSVQGILEDAFVLALFLAVVWCLDYANHQLFGEAGKIFLKGSWAAFPFEWLVDAGHIGAISTFIIRSLVKIMRAG